MPFKVCPLSPPGHVHRCCMPGRPAGAPLSLKKKTRVFLSQPCSRRWAINLPLTSSRPINSGTGANVADRDRKAERVGHAGKFSRGVWNGVERIEEPRLIGVAIQKAMASSVNR